MRLLVFRVYPGPGVVADRQLGQDHRKPGDRIVFADPAAAAIGLDRLDDGAPSLVDQQPGAAARRWPGRLGDEVYGTPLGTPRRTVHGVGRRAADWGERAGQGT